MTSEPTASGGGDPGQVTRIAEEFIRLHGAGEHTDLDEFCARYPEDQQADVRQECEQLLRIRGVIKQPERLTAGQKLASYQVIEQIGKGGMGEVYRARDSKLDRDIAIKVLPPELACQPERVQRFEREAKAIAALDHPNIVTIYTVEQSNGLHFITMQLVQGKTLSELIPKRGMPLEKFFELAIPLADAISTAHESGITHRDLKPANIMVTADGRVEILDFGLAKLTQEVTAERTTQLRLSSLTIEGQIVGTVAYMSPEQAEGRDVDHRTDIFSLGIILYEMVTGERPFKGETQVALMSAIMKDTPTAVRSLKPSLPNHLGRTIRRTLEKDPDQRFQTSKDLRNELAHLKRDIDSGEMIAPVQQVHGRRWLWPAVSAALVVALLLGFFATGWLSTATASVFRGEIAMTGGVSFGGTYRTPIVISPNGSLLLFASGPLNEGQAGSAKGLHLRRIDESQMVPLDETEGAIRPFFSPDGAWIGYFDLGDRKLKKIAVSGGAPVTLADVTWPWGGTWSADNTIVYARDPNAGLWRVDASGNSPAEELTTLATGEIEHAYPSALPDGQNVLFSINTGSGYGNGKIAVVSLATGDTKVLMEGGGVPTYSSTGHIIYFRGGRLLARQFDLDRLEVTGTAIPVVDDVLAEPGYEVPLYALSAAGHLVYAPGTADAERTMVWVDRDGNVTPVSDQKRKYWGGDLAPDGSQIAYATRGADASIWIYNVKLGTQRKFTSGNAQSGSPRWSPSGSKILYTEFRGGLHGLWVKDATGDREAQRVFSRPGVIYGAAWKDEQSVAVVTDTTLTNHDIWLVNLNEPEDVKPLLNSAARESSAAFLPDGALAYRSDRSERDEIYVRFPDGTAKDLRISREGGKGPMWSADGRKLFYRYDGGLFVAERDDPKAKVFEAPREVLSKEDLENIEIWDVTADGTNFLGVNIPPIVVESVIVVLNWSIELEALTNGDGRMP